MSASSLYTILIHFNHGYVPARVVRLRLDGSFFLEHQHYGDGSFLDLVLGVVRP